MDHRSAERRTIFSLCNVAAVSWTSSVCGWLNWLASWYVVEKTNVLRVWICGGLQFVDLRLLQVLTFMLFR